MNSSKLSFLFIFSLFQLFFFIGNGQVNKLIVGNTDSMYYKSLNINIGVGFPISSYSLDINNDSIPDFVFSTNSFGNANYVNEWTKITSFDSTLFNYENFYDSTCTYMEDSTIYYSYSLPKKNYLGDTINLNDTLLSTATYITYWWSNSGWPACSFDRRDYWYDGNYRFITFKKYINGNIYWGWIQVKVQNGFARLNIKDFAFSFSKVESIDALTINEFSIYPVPARDYIFIKGENINSYLIENCTGQLIMSSKLNPVNEINTVNVESLLPGIYIIKINSKNAYRSKRFIKE